MSIFEKLSRSLVVNFWSLYNTQQTHERWIKAETTLIANVHRRCFNVYIWLKMKVEPTYLYWRCFNISKTTLKQRWLNHVDSTSMNQSCFNVEIWLKMKVEPTYIYRCCFKVDKTTLKKRFTSIQCWWPNVVSTLIFCWKGKLSQRMFIGVEKSA